MKKLNNTHANNTTDRKSAFKEILGKVLISLKSEENEFTNLSENEYLFQQLKNFGEFPICNDQMFYYFKSGDNFNINNYNIMKIILNFYNLSQFSNLKKEYNLSACKKFSNTNNSLILTHVKEDVNKFLNCGISQGFHYALFGNTLCGKTYFIETLIMKNIDLLMERKSKILIISTNQGFSYSKIQNICNKNCSKMIQNVIDIIRFRTDNDVVTFLNILNKAEKLPYSFIFIDTFNKINDKKNNNLNSLNINVENLKKNKNIGVVSIIFKEYNSRVEIKDFKNLVCSDPQNSIMTFDYQLNFFNLDINLRLFNMKKRKYFVKIYNYNGLKAKNYKTFDISIKGKLI